MGVSERDSPVGCSCPLVRTVIGTVKTPYDDSFLIGVGIWLSFVIKYVGGQFSKSAICGMSATSGTSGTGGTGGTGETCHQFF